MVVILESFPILFFMLLLILLLILFPTLYVIFFPYTVLKLKISNSYDYDNIMKIREN